MHFLGQFFISGFAPEFLLHVHRYAAHLGNFVHQVNRQADGLGLVGQRALDRLLDPPGPVGGELAALGGVKAGDSLHQAHVAFINEIQERQAEVVIVTGNLHHQPEVRLDHVLLSLLVPLLDAGRQLNLLLNCQKRRLRNFVEVELDGRVAIISSAGTTGLIDMRDDRHRLATCRTTIVRRLPLGRLLFRRRLFLRRSLLFRHGLLAGSGFLFRSFFCFGRHAGGEKY